MSKATNPTPATRSICARRDMQCCVRCGKPLYGSMASLHHRRMRSHGWSGLHEASNLIWLCGSGTQGCHGYVHMHPAEAYAHGYLVHSYDDPHKIPVEHAKWGECFLWDDGSAMTIPEPETGQE